MSNVIILQNYKRSLEINGSTSGFEDEALGACIGLVQFGYATDAVRMAWIKAAERAAIKPAGTGATVNAKQFFYRDLLTKRGAAFGAGLHPDWKGFNYADYPWGLPEPIFRKLDAELQQNKGTVLDAVLSWKELTNTASSAVVKYGLQTPVGAAGLALVRYFIKRYVPELAAFLAADLTVPLAATAMFGAFEGEQLVARLDNARTKARYEIDRKRRDYDRKFSGGLGT